MPAITIQHVDQSDPPQFIVVSEGKNLGPFEVASPYGFEVKGIPNSDLIGLLRWYLEKFLDYPYPPEDERAEKVLDALRTWGESVFEAIFDNRETIRILDASTLEGYRNLELVISSDDPSVLQWPWEAIRSPERGYLSQACQIKRRLNKDVVPSPLSDQLPKDQVNILLVTARPLENDVKYRSISRRLVEQVDELNLPAKITVLRPPTLSQLRKHLTENQNHYHILHFDGHGSYGGAPTHDSSNAFDFRTAQGQLIFEDDHGKPDPHDAERLAELLQEYHIPVVVLNACQSGMVDERAKDAFASVAASLQRSGVRSVVAMAYSLYVSGAQQFLPDFYQRLFSSGSIGEATRAGRQKMLERQERVCARGQFKLQDWLVPVVYEQGAIDFTFAAESATESDEAKVAVPDQALDVENPYGFIGRDNAVLELERALHRSPAGILVTGLGGIGKTTLAKGFIRWLASTNGLDGGCFWFSFQDVRSAESIVNQMVGSLFGTDTLSSRLEEKVKALVAAFKQHRFLIVWDNFEVVRGIDGANIKATLSTEDQNLLFEFLKQLRGGKTKVLITSRSSEDWLLGPHCVKQSLGGLQGEERWEFCESIINDFGIDVDRKDEAWKKLVDMLDGHPLAMRVILQQLGNGKAPIQLIKAINENVGQFESESEDSAKLFATMEFVNQGLPSKLRELLIPLSLHEEFVLRETLLDVASSVSPHLSESDIGLFLETLSSAGLLRSVRDGIYQIHPTLTRFLKSTISLNPSLIEQWTRSFVHVMGTIANHNISKQLNQQRPIFHLFGSSFSSALDKSQNLKMESHVAVLTQSLAAFAQINRNWSEAENLYQQLAGHLSKVDSDARVASPYHQLGIIAHERRDFETAERWYLKSLEIKERSGNEHGAAITYHQLGRIAEERRDFETAERWYLKSLEINERSGNEHVAAITYHHLGRIAQERRDFETAKRWYLKSLEIDERSGNEHGAASTYHRLGIIAEACGEIEVAERKYYKSAEINERSGNTYGAVLNFLRLRTIAEDRGDRESAKSLLPKSRSFFENLDADTQARLIEISLQDLEERS